MTNLTDTGPLWQPSKDIIENANLTEFISQVGQKFPPVTDFNSLYRWSIESSDLFWSHFWDYSHIVSSHSWDSVLTDSGAMPGASWFKGARLNFAENLLRYQDDKSAIVSVAEGKEERTLTYTQLYSEVSRCTVFLKNLGISKGDRVAGYMANNIEAVVGMLATASIGAIWSSCSPDFGVKGVLERFAQIEPKVLFAVDGYQYGGKRHNILDRVESVVRSIPSIEKVVIVPFLEESPSISSIDRSILYTEATKATAELKFAQLPFDHPLYILYSSGTTGKPKCIVHGAGGTLIQHLKEHLLHTDIKRDDVLFFFTTCGWMMWNWLISGISSGCTIVLYDGSPFYPDKNSMWKMAEKQGITVFGTSARFLAACAKSGLVPKNNSNLSALRTILSTGSPLVSEGFDYVYQNISRDIMLSSISGGTDIISCFVLGNPLRPVYKGEIQCRGLGMAVDVYDDGKPVQGTRGELVCTKPFPSMPLGFWNESDHTRYHEAYFERFEGIWSQGDFAEITDNDGIIIYGRSDAVLNPGGVRIGTAEIYRQVEKVDEVLESMCIAQRWDGDVRIVLFVVLKQGIYLTDKLIFTIRTTILENTTYRHVPEKIIAVPDLPRTLSGKITEIAVRNIVHGDSVKNTEALANPETLEYFRDLKELQ